MKEQCQVKKGKKKKEKPNPNNFPVSLTAKPIVPEIPVRCCKALAVLQPYKPLSAILALLKAVGDCS